jgi:hypothetical protein
MSDTDDAVPHQPGQARMTERVRRQLQARAGGNEPHVAVSRARGQPASGAANEQRPLGLGREVPALLEPLVENLAYERVERDLALDLALAQDDEDTLRVRIRTSSTSSATVSEIRSAVNSISTTSARGRTGALSAARSNRRCVASSSARGAAIVGLSRPTCGRPSPRHRYSASSDARARLTVEAAARVYCQLNKHESINALEDAVFYGNEGRIRLRTLDRQSPRPRPSRSYPRRSSPGTPIT